MASPVSLTDFKAYLNLTSNSGPGGDTELQAFLDTATDILSYRIGAITSTALVERCNGGTPYVVLEAPIISVTSVVEWIGASQYPLTLQDYATATVGAAYGFSIDGPKTLSRRTLGFPTRFAAGRYNVIVSYQGGFSSVPNVVLTAIKELGKHLFKSQSSGRSNGQQQAPVPNADVSLPPRVRELIAPWDDEGMA